jgi:hypothetical protein
MMVAGRISLKKSLWQAADHQKKTGLYVFTSPSCAEQTGGEKLAALLSLLLPLVKL